MQKPIELKISMVPSVCLILHTQEVKAIEAALKEVTSGAEDFFDNDITILDFSHLSEISVAPKWGQLATLLKKFRLHLAAIRNPAPDIVESIRASGLAVDFCDSGAPENEATKKIHVPQDNEANIGKVSEARPALVIDSPVRAGQRIYAQGADLIITASVNAGAEVLADGNIHIYGALKGRAQAGAVGEMGARIFALRMEPELVSIAGYYLTFENGVPALNAKNACQVRLDGERIEIVALPSFDKN